MVKRIVSWQTSDGQVFNNDSEAWQHEFEIGGDRAVAEYCDENIRREPGGMCECSYCPFYDKNATDLGRCTKATTKFDPAVPYRAYPYNNLAFNSFGDE